MAIDVHIIREMSDSDLDEAFEISENCGFSTWRKEDYQRELAKPESIMLVAEKRYKDGADSLHIEGFLLSRLITPEAELLNIAVKEKCRRSGVGSMLFEHFMNECLRKEIENVWLEVRESNRAAINFYLSKGFKKVGKRTSYYNNPVEDAILMTLRYSLKNGA